MIIILKNKDTLQVDDFTFKCSIGKKGLTSKKIEGDEKTPKGIFKLDKLYFRKDRHKKPDTKLECKSLKNYMGWCNDVKNPKNYNKLIKKDKKLRYESMFRKDSKYDFVIPIKYNFKKPRIGRGSAIFLHITKDYKPTAGCIALQKKDFLILLRLINKNSKIKII